MSLLSLFERKTLSYCGSESYRHVDRLLKDEREVLIVSPYIDDYYAEFLLRHSGGKTFRILSSSMKESAAKKLRSSRIPGALALNLIILIVNVMFLYAGKLSSLFSAITFSLSLLYLASAFLSRNRIYIRTPKAFIHAKMYVGNSAAIEGSANLTYPGMHRNIEQISMTKEGKRISEMKREFWRLWNAQ
jgi:phosphatidylserine/phosphatidylglycerophosphate/cardiolipin synthase-like enzyme